jgi:hypothetical protein
MNEQIQQLAEQARLLTGWPVGEIEYQKFAELIIQECLNICEEMGDNGMDGHYCADKIAKTFQR